MKIPTLFSVENNNKSDKQQKRTRSMLQAIYKRQIIQAGAFAAGGREARGWRKAG